ncbi:MAG: hypothetical protein WC497_01385 [Patescibacteria group bacterium]
MSSTMWSWKQWGKLVLYDVFFLIVIGIALTAVSHRSIFGQLIWLAGLTGFSGLIGLVFSIGPRYFVNIENRPARIALWFVVSAAVISPLALGTLWAWELKAGLDAFALLGGGLAGYFWSQLDHWRRTLRAGTIQPSRLA